MYLKRRPVCSVFGTPPQMLLMEIRDFLMKFCLVKIALVLAQLDLTALVENLDCTEAVLFFFFKGRSTYAKTVDRYVGTVRVPFFTI